MNIESLLVQRNSLTQVKQEQETFRAKSQGHLTFSSISIPSKHLQ